MINTVKLLDAEQEVLEEKFKGSFSNKTLSDLNKSQLDYLFANKDKVNPSSVILSAVMMLNYMGWKEAANSIEYALEKAIFNKKVTYDFHRLMDNATLLKCSEFGDEIISKF